MEVSHIIFDLDGTVVDSESLLFAAVDSICLAFGRSADPAVKRRLLGHPFKERALQLYSELRFEGILSFKAFVSQLLSECRTNVSLRGMALMPGVRSLVEHFRRHDIPMAIASGNDRKSYDETALRFGHFFDNFSHCVLSGDESERIEAKPCKDIYVKAFERFSPPPESPANVLVFEDTEVGVVAAVSAGMKCVFVADERFNATQESDSVATLVINSLTHFRPEEFGLPAIQG